MFTTFSVLFVLYTLELKRANGNLEMDESDDSVLDPVLMRELDSTVQHSDGIFITTGSTIHVG